MTEAEDKNCLDGVIDDAKEAALANAKANLGTALHGFTQRLDLGENSVNVPSQWKADIDAYLAAMKNYGLWTYDTFIERVLLIPELEAAGTVDRLLSGDALSGDMFNDLPVVGDLKTGKVKGKGRSFAVQLAIYAHATHWHDPAANTYHEMPKMNQQRAVVIHLPVGKGECHFYEVDIEAGWEAAKLAYEIHKWRKRDDLTVQFSKWIAPEQDSPSDERAPTARDASVVGSDRDTGAPSASLGEHIPLPGDEAWAPPDQEKHNAAYEAKAKGKRKPAAKRKDPANKGLAEEFKNEREAAVAKAKSGDSELFDARFAYARERVKYIIDHGKGAELGDLWLHVMPDIPTFKQGGPRTHEEIDRIAATCSIAEMANSLPLPDFVDPAKEKNTTNQLPKGQQQHEQHELATSSK